MIAAVEEAYKVCRWCNLPNIHIALLVQIVSLTISPCSAFWRPVRPLPAVQKVIGEVKVEEWFIKLLSSPLQFYSSPCLVITLASPLYLLIAACTERKEGDVKQSL